MYYNYYSVFIYFAVFVRKCYNFESLRGWSYINLHCRDNYNKPVDWWYVYKPPVDPIPFKKLGREFKFITPDSEGRWETAFNYITTNSMLQHTLAPIFRPTYTDYLAVIAYESRKKGKENIINPTRGVLLADEKGGILMGHTVPGLLDFSKDRLIFPERELPNGHLLMCLSLDLPTLNEMAVLIRNMSPRYTRIQMPPRMKSYLPSWNFLDLEGWKGFKHKLKGPGSRDFLEFVTRNNSIHATLMVRRPGVKECLYKKFARTKKLVLDVYGHGELRKSICEKDYSLRIIDKISMKDFESVDYIKKSKDRAGFAVSTAAHWQRAGGAGANQYWTCTSSLDDAYRGGVMLCVEDYNVWLTFDRFKVKEPEC